jgi:hypothetical protein
MSNAYLKTDRFRKRRIKIRRENKGCFSKISRMRGSNLPGPPLSVFRKQTKGDLLNMEFIQRFQNDYDHIRYAPVSLFTFIKSSNFIQVLTLSRRSHLIYVIAETAKIHSSDQYPYTNFR